MCISEFYGAKKFIAGLSLASCCLVSTSSALAFSFILVDWQDQYPNSLADTIPHNGCQLCHVNEAGASPWNAYGWSIREALQGSSGSNQQAFEDVEFENQDGDPIAANSFDEIIRNFQPGWTAGNSNTHFFKDGSEAANMPPPDLSAVTSTTLDFPAVVANPIPTAISNNTTTLALQEVAAGFNAPLSAVKAPGIDGSLFVVEQTGKVFRVDLETGDKTLFHDVSADLVATGERGLLGLAFHPDYATNGLFYTYQSEPVRSEQDDDVDFSTVAGVFNPNHRSMVVEYRASEPSCNSMITKRDILMIVDQPQGNHNGGDLAFDSAGFLYIPLGDGGNSGDVGPGHSLLGNGRDKTNVLGSILRIDPLGGNSANGRYGVPASNPFTANGDDGEDEIFAYGFRNPYRISFDGNTNELYAGDVGQGEIEELDLVVNGGNYGWNWKEGSFFFYNPQSEPRYVSDVASPGLPDNLVDPIGEYGRQDGQAVIGGFVYRGSTISNAHGDYIFGDYVGDTGAGGGLYSLDLSSNIITEYVLTNPVPGFVTGFGQDADNELYVVTNDQASTSGLNGTLTKLVEMGDISSTPDGLGETAECPVLSDQDLCLPIKASNGKTSVICL